MVLLFASSYLPSVNTILQSSISAIGYQICFYLGLTGLACAWYYRATICMDFTRSLTRVIWPTLSALFLFFILIYSTLDADRLTNIVGLGGIAIGIIPLIMRKEENTRK